MMQVYLSNDQLALFLKIIKDYTLFEVKDNSIIFDEHKRELIVDKISDYFALEGLNKDYEPNKKGIEIENLLDKFV